MTTQFMYKALATAALSIALSLSLAAPPIANAASSNTAEAIQVDPPAAPSNCRSGHYRLRDPREGYDKIIYYVSWRDNSTNEDGFTGEWWARNESGEWVLSASFDLPANTTRTGSAPGNGYRFRVKAFNAAGDSAWSKWAN